MCPHTCLRIGLKIAVMLAWPLRKADVKSDFLQTGAAQRDMYVIPPRKCPDKRFVFQIDTAAYGLFNANPKWQKMSDDAFRELETF